MVFLVFSFFFFFNDTATTEIYTLSLHDALPISSSDRWGCPGPALRAGPGGVDRKSTRLNSSHGSISYAVFCLKKKKKLESDNLFNNLIQRNQSTACSSGKV